MAEAEHDPKECVPGPCQDVPEVTFAVDNGGPYKPPANGICVGEVDYSTSECAEIEADYLASLQAEALEAAAGPVNVFLMLGVHSQGSTMATVSATGFPLSSGTPAGYNALDAFNVNGGSWRSIQAGQEVVTTPAYIGYSLGTKKAWDKIGPPQERYNPAEPVRKKIGTLRIKQGSDPLNRVKQVRVEASDDGVTWIRITVVNLADTDQLVSAAVNASAAYNQWRLVPTFFNGVAAGYQWEVLELHFVEATSTALDNIQDFFLLENRDRAYCRQSTMIKCTYDLLDVQTELARFGINLPQTYIFTCSFAIMVQKLGRPVVVGDVLELPGEVQYDPNLKAVRKWLEVTDTTWATEGYAFNWKPLLFKFYAQPILPSVEHRDLLGLPGKINQAQTDDDFLSTILTNNQAYQASSAIKQEMADKVPQTGSDPADIQSGRGHHEAPGSYDGDDLYVQDATPPDGAPFTTGDTLPLGVTANHWHRQTYTNVPAHLRPADRLLRWDGSRWRVIEVNTKVTYESHKRTASRILSSPNMVDPDYKP